MLSASALAVVLVVNIAWGLAGSDPLVSLHLGSSAPLALRIAGVTSATTAGGSTLDVEVQLRNASAERQRGVVWWQLAPASVAGSAWGHRVYESAVTEVDLAPFSEARFSWAERPLVPSASYRVDAWTRVDRHGELVPSDGRESVPASVALDTGPLRLLRHAPTPTGVVVVAASYVGGDAGTSRLDVALENHGSDTKRGWLGWRIYTLGGRPLADWWHWGGSSPGKRYQQISVAPGEHTVVHLNAPFGLAPGTYGLRASLDPSQVAGSETAAPPDDVLALVTVPPAGPGAPQRAHGAR